MNGAPLELGALSFTDDGIPFSARYADIYHPRAGAFTQARHVFIRGNELPQRWDGRDRFVVLETGFGLGNNFLATWAAWRDDPKRCERLVFVSIEAHPLSADELGAAHAESPVPELAAALRSAWPPRTPNLHTMCFDDGRVQLMLALGDVQQWLPELIVDVDAFFLDGFAPAGNPRMWDLRVCKALSRLAAPGATLATWTAAQSVRQHLTTAGFAVRLAQGTGGKRDITLARYEPQFTPRRAVARVARAGGTIPHAIVIGAGLAGCATTWALAEQGWRTTLIERQAHIAAGGSGNPAGLFHGIVNAQDGVHARFNRAAALMASTSVRTAIDRHDASGATNGLLRLETTMTTGQMRDMLARLCLPPDYVQALDPTQASAASGIAIDSPAWFYPAGGWVHPAGLARAWLALAGDRVEQRMGVEVDSLQRADSGWRLLDSAGAMIAESATVILANAGAAMRLLGQPDWPIEAVRGQISVTLARQLTLPRIPVAGSGYLLPEIDGRVLFGATSQRDDDDVSVRVADHAANLAQLAKLLGHSVDLAPGALEGRTAWRCRAADRLPVIGAVPDRIAADDARLDHPRMVPRLPGLYVFTALGSRGITWSALGARLLASAVTGAPSPLEASLVDAVDPARFVSRAARRRPAD